MYRSLRDNAYQFFFNETVWPLITLELRAIEAEELFFLFSESSRVCVAKRYGRVLKKVLALLLRQ